MFTFSMTSFLNSQSAVSGRPRSYVSWILFDEQFKLVSSSSGFEQVGSDEEFKEHVKNNMPIDKNGYLYIYISNTTPNINVFFDNLQVTHIRSQILEETHYYPFGLTMAGISTKAAGGMENKYGITSKEFQAKEFSDGVGLEMYDFGARMQYPQIGRWFVTDALAEKDFSWSPYRYSYNNPFNFINPDGMWEVEVRQRTTKNKNGKEKTENYMVLVAETDDNIQTLADQTGLDIEKLKKGLAGKEITTGTALDALGIKSADDLIKGINQALNYNKSQQDQSNCWGTALSLVLYGNVYLRPLNDKGKDMNGVISSPYDADDMLQSDFKQTAKPKFGDIVRYANENGYAGTENEDLGANKGDKPGGTSHYAVYLLKSKNDPFVFSKNGAASAKKGYEPSKWEVQRQSTLPATYGNPMAIGSGSAIYTRK